MLVAPFAAVEDTVMADIARQMILLLRQWQMFGQVERGAGLADTGDIVVLAFDRQQCGVADGIGIDRLAAMDEFALGQRMLLEYVFDRLQVEFGRSCRRRDRYSS